MWPDHPRCGVAVDLVDPGGRRVTAVGVHLAWHVNNAGMSARLRDAIDTDDPLVVLGDFNTWPGTTSFSRLTAAPLRDACPGAPATTLIDKRVDLVLVSEQWAVHRALDRRRAYDVVPPTSSLTLPGFRSGSARATAPPIPPVARFRTTSRRGWS